MGKRRKYVVNANTLKASCKLKMRMMDILGEMCEEGTIIEPSSMLSLSVHGAIGLMLNLVGYASAWSTVHLFRTCRRGRSVKARQSKQWIKATAV
jgi:hypothetical protein